MHQQMTIPSAVKLSPHRFVNESGSACAPVIKREGRLHLTAPPPQNLLEL